MAAGDGVEVEVKQENVFLFMGLGHCVQSVMSHKHFFPEIEGKKM